MIATHHITTQRTARYFTIGHAGPEVREVVYAFHGYGQLAGRFASRLEQIGMTGRLVVVPEGLSRFYVRGLGNTGDAQVGASWMTREDRDSEIADQVSYLDALHRRVLGSLDGAAPRVTLLGFSQGTATAGRWLAHGSVRPATLVLWAGRLPPELEPRLPELLAGMRVIVAVGRSDELAPQAQVGTELERLERAGVQFERLSFDGGHELDGETLRRIFPVNTT